MSTVKRKVFSFECSTLGELLKKFIQDNTLKMVEVVFADGSKLPTDNMNVLSMTLVNNQINMVVESVNFVEVDDNSIPVFEVKLLEVA